MGEVSKKTRKPAVAGLFYPADPDDLREEIRSCLQQARDVDITPKAIIAPHAGTIYSGLIAASAYASLEKVRDKIQRVILIGPAHRVGFEGLAMSQADFFETPLGVISVDRKSLDEIAHLPQVITLDQAHREEHSLEVHLPFLQEVLRTFRIVPLVVGVAGPQEVAGVLEKLWGGPETLIVISSDLSHYYPYRKATSLDQETAKMIERLEWEKMDEDRACGHYPVRGFLLAARRYGLKGRIVDLRNSGDTAGTQERVVGYGAFFFYD